MVDDAIPLAQKYFHLLGPLKDKLRGTRWRERDSYSDDMAT